MMIPWLFNVNIIFRKYSAKWMALSEFWNLVFTVDPKFNMDQNLMFMLV